MKHLNRFMRLATALAVCSFLAACDAPESNGPLTDGPVSYNLVLRGGTIYDGSGGPAYVGDVAFNGEMIAALGDLGDATAMVEIDVQGLAVAPGFVNMMCWSNESLIEDGRSQSDIKYDIEWTTLAEYLEYLEQRGIAPNVASFIGAATPGKILLTGFKNEALKPLTGKTLKEVAEMRGTDSRYTAMDLIIEDGSRVSTVYFSQSEDVVRKAVGLPWVSFNSDEASMAPEGVFLKSSAHPRAYGSFARVLGKYVRDEQVLSLEEAVRKLAALPAKNLRIDRRGELKEGYFADVVVFNPDTIQDHATFVDPHQYATGMVHVFVNGVQVLKDGQEIRPA